MRCGIILLLAVVTAAEEPLPEYRRVREISGVIRIQGSTTVGLLAEAWTRPMRKLYPGVKVDRYAHGTEVAMAALTAGRCDLAAMTRRADANERAAFRKRHGHDPVAVVVAFDALAVYVHRDNPIRGLTLQELDAVFGAERLRGGKRLTRWGDLGLGGDWAERKLYLFGFGPKDGAHTWMRSRLLKGGPFKGIINEQYGAGGLVTACGSERRAIGYASHAYATRRTRLVPLAAQPGGPFHAPTRENCLNGKYPLARELLFYVNKLPGKKLAPMLEEYLALATSELGQRFVERAHAYRIDMKTAQANLKAIER
ncbi:MAG: PstS family phosphate ABC transporter substrate-binding protein [Planctomycetota bacterium]|jgi:phosphate transport system substrate-binding protein